MTDARCGTCGTMLPAANVLYDEDGNVTCQRCLLAAQTVDAQKRSAAKVVAIAYGGPFLALGAFIFNPFLLVSAAAVGNGVYVLRSLKQSDTAHLVAQSVEKAKVGAIAGIVLGVISGLTYFLRFIP